MLTAVVSDLNTIPEAHRGFYVQRDGKFFLQVTPAEGYNLEDVTGLKTALTAERTAHAATEAALRPFKGMDAATIKTAVDRAALFDGLDPTDIKTKVAGFDRLSKIDPEKEADKLANAKFENSKTQLQSQFTTEKNALTEELTSTKTKLANREAQVLKLLKNNAVVAEVAKANPLDELRDVVEKMIADAVQLKDVNGEYVPVVVDEAGNARVKLAPDFSSIPFTVADLVAEFRDKRAALFKPTKTITGISGNPQDRGTAGRPAAGDQPNPFSKKTWNLTQQVLLKKRNPDLAARLEAEAA